EPLLVLILSCGGADGAIHAADAYAPLANFFGLDDRSRVFSREEKFGDNRDEPYFNNLVQWARQNLIDRGDLHSTKRGIWRLTSQGRRRAERARDNTSTQSLEAFRKYKLAPASTEGREDPTS